MVPNGWKNTDLNSISHRVSVGLATSVTGAYTEIGVPIIRNQNIKEGYFDDSDMLYLEESFSSLHPNKRVRAGDVITVHTGSNVGLTCVVPEKYDLAQTFTTLIVTPKTEDLNPWFLNYVINSNYGKYQALRLVVGGGKGNLNTSDFKNYPILLPPLVEQKNIVKLLSTWDKAISTTERLIDNSQQQKKALMQQLLTGKQRLLDDSGERFSGDWSDNYLHEVAKIIVSPVNKKIVEGEIPVELCNYTDVYYNIRITKSLTFMKATAKQSEIDKYTLQVGDVIITKDSETPGDIAIPALVSEDLGGVVCGYHLAIIRPNGKALEGSYLNYLLSMPKTRYYFFTLANGATRFGLSVGSINNAQFTLPPLEEQQKIATVLTNADREIELLQQQLADLQQEKKALMQQLLTGKRRVLVNEEG